MYSSVCPMDILNDHCSNRSCTNYAEVISPAYNALGDIGKTLLSYHILWVEDTTLNLEFIVMQLFVCVCMCVEICLLMCACTLQSLCVCMYPCMFASVWLCMSKRDIDKNKALWGHKREYIYIHTQCVSVCACVFEIVRLCECVVSWNPICSICPELCV